MQMIVRAMALASATLHLQAMAQESAPVGSPIPVDAPAETGAVPEARAAGLSSTDEIVVTAQKREESIADVPVSVSAFSGDDLAALGVEDTRDLGNLVPGFSYADSGYTVPIYTLRGVGFNESSQTASATVGIYVDEQNLAFPVFSKGANLDLARVEVLKGPQGTLYGRNTTGGAVNYIANRPTDALEAGFHGGVSRFETIDAEAFVSGPLTDSLRGRLAYRRMLSGKGWQYSLTRGEDGDDGRLGEIDKHAGRAILEWRPVDAVKTAFTLSLWTDDSEPQAPQAIGFQPQNPITGSLIGNAALAPEVQAHPLVPVNGDSLRVADWPTGFDWQLHERFRMVANRTDWSLDDTTLLTFLGAWSDFENDHGMIPQSGLSEVNTERDLVVESKAHAFELRLQGEAGDDVEWLVGGYLSADEVYEYQTIFIDTNSAAFVVPGLLPLLDLGGFPSGSAIVGSPVSDRVDTYGDQEADTWAFFANGTWQFQPTMALTLGARYTREDRRFEGCSIDSPSSTRGVGFAAAFTGIALARPLTNPGSPVPTAFAQPGGCFTLDPATNNAGLYEGRLDQDNVSGRAALEWTPGEDRLFYASYSRGFKSGSFPVFASSDQAQYEPITQERLDAFEAGLKTAFFDRRLRVNAAAFYYDYRDKQLVGRIVDAVFGPLQKLVNAPESTVQGVELELQTSPVRGLFLAATASYIETEVKEFEGLDQSGDPVDLSGKPFNFSPELEYVLVADYVWAITDRLDAGLGADYSYTDSTNSVLTGDPLFEIEDYGLVNARASLGAPSGRWKVTLWCRNLTDEFYSNGVFNTGDAVGRYAGQPRMTGLTLDLRFD